MYIIIRILYFFVHDVKELVEGKHDETLKYDNHGIGTSIRSIILIMVIVLFIIIYTPTFRKNNPQEVKSDSNKMLEDEIE